MRDPIRDGMLSHVEIEAAEMDSKNHCFPCRTGASETPVPVPLALASSKSLRMDSTTETIVAMLYPMWLISVPNLLQLDKLEPHQRLQAKDLLVKWTPDLAGRVLFVSHQWLGWEEPDAAHEHLHALQHLLRRLLSGDTGDVEADWLSQLFLGIRGATRVSSASFKVSLPHMFVWMDYVSMPQNLEDAIGQKEDGMNAIRSIPAYVERSSIMLVLAPPATHKDLGVACGYKSWRSRGWCRMEYIAAVLARRPVPILISQAPTSSPEFIFPLDTLTLLAGEASFTCCARNHDFGSGTVPCDKIKIRSVMVTLLDAKIGYFHDKGKLADARFFTSFRPRLLHGLPPAPDEEEPSVAMLKRQFRWRTDAEEARWAAKTGVTLLFAAVLTDHRPTVLEVFRTNAAVLNAATRIEWKALGGTATKGWTPLLLAMTFCSWSVVEVLLDAGARPDARVGTGQNCVQLAATFGQHENIRAWMRRFPSWDLEQGDKMKAPALLPACLFGPNKLETVRALLDVGADRNAHNKFGFTPLHDAAANPDAEPETIRMLVRAGCNVNGQVIPPSLGPGLVLGVMRFATRLGMGGKLARHLATTKRTTPLHNAAMRGDVDLCRVLLEANADPTMRNAMGLTPLEQARRTLSGSRTGAAPAALEALL